jgi:hypothetical protein
VSQDRERVLEAFGQLEPGYEHRQILRSAQWGLAAMPAPISFGRSRTGWSARVNVKHSAATASFFRCLAFDFGRNLAALPLRRFGIDRKVANHPMVS